MQEVASTTETAELARPNFFVELWQGVRPYLLCLVKDLLVSACFYVAIFLFHLLGRGLPIEGWAGLIVVQFHSIATVVATIFLGWLFVNDVIQIRRGQK